jgi:hypothetical protein
VSGVLGSHFSVQGGSVNLTNKPTNKEQVMNIRRSFSILAAALACIVSITAFSGSAAAQGRYVGQYSKSDVSDIIRRVEDSGDTFRNAFRNELDRSNLSSSQKRTYRNQADSFENATDRLRTNFDSQNSWWESRNQVQNVLSNTRPLNTTMVSIAFRRNIERQWNQLRNDVNKLADTYDLPGIAGGGWNGGPWNPGNPGNPGGGQTSTPPSWAQGTFYSNYPAITVTINRNGQVTAINNGQTYYGRFYRNQIYLNNDVSTVSRNGNGIRTYNRNSGQTTDYSRGTGGGGGGGGDWGGPVSNPPSWARGTFYGNGITLTIASNGRITVISGGQTYYGRYYNNQIYLNNDVSTVSRNGNGIRTYNQNSGQTTNYRRN